MLSLQHGGFIMDSVNRALEDFEKQRERLRSAFAAVGDLRPGSLVERHHKCGKPGCHCARKDSPGHGPNWVLTRAVAGKTVTRGIPGGAAVQQAREQIEEYHRFRTLVQEFIDVSEKLCHIRIQVSRAASKEAAEKGGSKRSSKPRSPKR